MALHLTQQLKRAMQDDPRKCILLVGAGLSAAAVRKGRKGLPDWDTLIQHMIDDLRDSERCDAENLKKLDELLKAGRHLEVSKFFKQYTRSDQFATFLKAELDPGDIGTSKLHQVILATSFRGIITTNFDDLIETAHGSSGPIIRVSKPDEYQLISTAPEYPQVMQDAEKAMFPYVAINPTDGYYSPTKDSKYAALQRDLSDKLNDIVVGRQPFSNLDQVAREWLDGGGSQMRTEFEREIAAARGA